MEKRSIGPVLAEAVEHEKRYEWDEAITCSPGFIEKQEHEIANFVKLSFKLGQALEMVAAQVKDAY